MRFSSVGCVFFATKFAFSSIGYTFFDVMVVELVDIDVGLLLVSNEVFPGDSILLSK